MLFFDKMSKNNNCKEIQKNKTKTITYEIMKPKL